MSAGKRNNDWTYHECPFCGEEDVGRLPQHLTQSCDEADSGNGPVQAGKNGSGDNP